MSLTQQQILDAELGEPQPHTILRDGDRDISCDGWLIGLGSASGGTGHTVKVRMWLTTGGNIITQTGRMTQWQGKEDTYTAAIHRGPCHALAWLVADGGDYLGPASKRAWEEACEAVPALERLATERVD